MSSSVVFQRCLEIIVYDDECLLIHGLHGVDTLARVGISTTVATSTWLARHKRIVVRGLSESG